MISKLKFLNAIETNVSKTNNDVFDNHEMNLNDFHIDRFKINHFFDFENAEIMNDIDDNVYSLFAFQSKFFTTNEQSKILIFESEF